MAQAKTVQILLPLVAVVAQRLRCHACQPAD